MTRAGRAALATVRAAGVGNVGVADVGDRRGVLDPGWIQNSPIGHEEPRTRVDPGQGVPAVPVDRATVATAVGYTLQLLGEQSPGNAVEVRIPPYGSIRCIDDPFHAGDREPDLIETDAATWLSSPRATCAGPTPERAASYGAVGRSRRPHRAPAGAVHSLSRRRFVSQRTTAGLGVDRGESLNYSVQYEILN